HPSPKVPEATSATGAFTLQLGASLNRDDAERQAARLREKGYAPYIVTAEVPGKGTWYRGRMGSFPTKDAATRYLQDVKRETQAEAFVASTRGAGPDDHDTTGGAGLGLRADPGAPRPLRGQAAEHHAGPPALPAVPQQE